MPAFVRKTYDNLYDDDSGRTISDIEFDRCTFRECTLSRASSPEHRTQVNGVILRSCTAEHCIIASPILREVTIDTLRSGKAPLFTRGAVFDRVTLTGRLDTILITPHADSAGVSEPGRAAFVRANAEFYRDVDWALDVRGAEASELEIYGVPSALVRRDLETTAVISRERALDEERWQGLDLQGTWWKAAINKSLLQDYGEVILVAPLRHPRVSDFVEGLARLRAAGVADATEAR